MEVVEARLMAAEAVLAVRARVDRVVKCMVSVR